MGTLVEALNMLSEQQYPFLQGCAKRIQYFSGQRIIEDCSHTTVFWDAHHVVW
jgi:hypothetical protein